MYISLARKYRPQIFDEIYGQEVAVKILQNSIITKRIHHAYIFSGVRGTGKTTAARILSKSLNCVKGIVPNPCNECENCKAISSGSFIDFIEMDAGSQTSVDDIRGIKEKALYPPVKGRFKVFVIDEAHMLSIAAFNALLKIFEEPPQFDIFILATTEPHKIPETVQSRAIRIDFRRIPKKDISKRLKIICEKENTKISQQAIELIAEAGEGSMRDSISLLEALWMYAGEREITEKDVEEVIGLAPSTLISELVEYTIKGDAKKVDEITQRIIEKGYNLKRVCKSFAEYIKEICFYLEGIKKDVDENIIDIINRTGIKFDEALRLINSILRFESDLSFSASEELGFKIFFIKLCYLKRIKPLKELILNLKRNSYQPPDGKKVFEEITNYLRSSGQLILAEEFSKLDWDFSGNSLKIYPADIKIKRRLENVKDEIENYLSDIGMNIKIVVQDKKPEIKPLNLGDEFEPLFSKQPEKSRSKLSEFVHNTEAEKIAAQDEEIW